MIARLAPLLFAAGLAFLAAWIVIRGLSLCALETLWRFAQ